MAELDPKTNLPKNNDSDNLQAGPLTDSPNLQQNGDGDDDKPSAQERLQAIRGGNVLQQSQAKTVQGTFGEYSPSAVLTEDKNFNEIRAQAQGAGELFGKALVQSAGTVVGMGIESIGFLGDIPRTMHSMVTGSEMEFERNPLSALGKSIQEASRDLAPIYKTEEAQSDSWGRFFDGTYIASHTPSVMSTLALYVPGMAGAKAGQGLARLFRMGRQGANFSATVGATLASRHAEGLLEGYESYEIDKQRALDNGFTEAQAEQFAQGSAGDTYKMGYSNVIMDAMSWGALFRPLNFASRALKGSIAELGEETGEGLLRQMAREMKRNPFLSPQQAAKKSGFSWKDYLAQSGMEGFEEFNQEFIKRINSHNADVAMGLTDKSEVSLPEAYMINKEGLMSEQLQDPKTWDATLAGFAGGLVFQGAGHAWNRSQQAEDAQRVKAQQERANYIRSTLQNINSALNRGDEVAAKKARDQLVMDMAVHGVKGDRQSDKEFYGAAVEGTLGNTMEMFAAIEQMDSQQLQELGLHEQSSEVAREIRQDLENFDGKLNSYYQNTIDTGADEQLALLKAVESHTIDKQDEYISELESKISEKLHSDESTSGALEGMSTMQKELIEKKREYDSKKKMLQLLENEGSNYSGMNPFRQKIHKKAREKSKSTLRKDLRRLAQEIYNITPSKQSDKLLGDMGAWSPQELGQEQADIEAGQIMNDQQTNEAMNIYNEIAGEDSDLQKFQDNLESSKIQKEESQSQLASLHQPETQAELVEQLDMTKEEIRQKAFEGIFKENINSGEYINKDGNLYRVRHSGQQTEYDYTQPSPIQAEQTGMPTGLSPEQAQPVRPIRETEQDRRRRELQEELEDAPDTDEVQLIEVDRNTLEPVEGAEYFTPEDISDYMDAQVVLPTRVWSEEQINHMRDQMDKAVEENRFDDLSATVTDLLVKSNYSDRMDGLINRVREQVQEKIDNAEGYQELMNIMNSIDEHFPQAFSEELINSAREKAQDFGDQFTTELESLDRAIEDKEEAIDDALERVEQIEEQIEEERLDFEDYVDSIISRLQEREEGGENVTFDGRTSEYKDIQNERQQLEENIQELKQQKREIFQQAEQLDRDIKTFRKLKNKILGDGSGTMPSVIVKEDFDKGLNEIETMRTKLLIRGKITEDNLDQWRERYKEAEQEIDQVIEAIENFRARLKNIEDASGIIAGASDDAYQEMVDRGLIPENASIMNPMPEQIFEKYRLAFNKHLTRRWNNMAKEDFENRVEVKNLVDETRFTQDAYQELQEIFTEGPSTAAHWAAMSFDTPVKSELYRAEDVQQLKNAQEGINRLSELRREFAPYREALHYMAREMERRKRAVEGESPPEDVKPSKGEQEVREYDAPQRVLESVFKRPTGNSGDNQNPNEDPSQRRYFRYVNKTNFKQEPHELRIVKPSDEYNIPLDEDLKEKGYNPDEVLFGIVMKDGKFVNEDGDTFSNFDPEKAIYTTMPLPTYETVDSVFGKTFDPEGSDYLEKLPGATKEDKLAYYEAKKEHELERYKILRNLWEQQIEENGYAERDILSKSKGVAIKKPKAGMYSQGVEPNSLSDVFDDPSNLEFTVSTTGTIEGEGGEVINVPEGFVQVYNPETGNYFEGARRRLTSEEIDNLINFLKIYVDQSTFYEDGRINKEDGDHEQASTLYKNGEPMDKRIFGEGLQGQESIFRDYVQSFDKGTKINWDRSPEGKKVPGWRIRIAGKPYDIFADNPDGEGKIDKLNSNLEDALRAHLSERFAQVSSIKTEKNESYKHYFIDGEGNPQFEKFDSYTDYLIDNEVVGTWRKPQQQMKALKDGTQVTEEGYMFKNQQVVFDNSLPAELEPEAPGATSTESSQEQLNSPDDLKTGYNYVTSKDSEEQAVWMIKKDGDNFEVDVANRDSLPQQERKRVEDFGFGQLAKGIQAGALKFTSKPEGYEGLPADREESYEDAKGEQSEEADQAERDFLSQMEETFGEESGDVDSPFDEDTDEDVEPPFQRSRETESEVVASRFYRVKNQLSEATGLPIHILHGNDGYQLLKEMEARGEFSLPDSITEDNLPYGMYHNGEVYIFKQGDYSTETLFHEVAHPLINQIIDENPLLWYDLQKEIDNSEQLSNIRDFVIEEYPNVFDQDGNLTTSAKAEIVVTAIGQRANGKLQKQSEENLIQRIFRYIKEFINKTFGSAVDVSNLDEYTTIDELADLLMSGQEINLTPDSVTAFQKKQQQDILQESELILPGNKDVKFTQDAMKFMDYLFFDELFKNHRDQLQSLFTQKTNEGLRREILQDSRKRIIKGGKKMMDMYKAGKRTFQGKDLQQQIKNYAYLITNFEAVENLHRKHLNKFHLETITEETWDDTEFEKDSNRLWQRESIKFSAKQNATSAIRFLVSSLKSSENNDTFAGPQNVDFGETFNLLANHLAGTTTLQEKKDVLEELADEDGIKNLQERLFGTDIADMTQADIGTAMYLLQFNETFSKHYNDYTLIKSDEGAMFKAIDATVNTSKRVIMHEWQSNTFDKPELYTMEGGRFAYDQEYFNKKYPEGYTITKDGYVTDEQEQWIQDQDIHGSRQQAYRNHFRTINFLEDIGVEFSWQAAHTPPGDGPNAEQERRKFNEKAQHVLNQIKSGQTPNIFAEDSDTYDDMNTFAQHEVNYSHDRVENQHLNIDGETVYNVVLNHYISTVEDTINKVNNLEELRNKLPHLFESRYTSNSLLLNNFKGDDQVFGSHKSGAMFNNLFDENGQRTDKEFTIDIIEGTSRKTDSVQFSDMAFSDKIHMTINAIMQDKFPMFRSGDKKLERFLNAQFLTKDQIKAENRSDRPYYNIFRGYLIDELNLINDIQDGDTYSGLEYLADDPIKLSIMPKILSRNKKLKSKLQKAIETGDVSAFRKPTQDTLEQIRDTIDEYVEEQVDKTEEMLEEQMLIQKDGKQYINNGLQGLTKNKGEAYNQKQLRNILRKVVINRAIANIEQTKLFTAHPAFYAKKPEDMEANIDNFFHRMSGSAGTKKNSSTGHDTNQLMEKFFPSNRQNRLYEVTDENGNSEVITEYRKGARPIIRSAVAADVKVSDAMVVDMVSRYTDNVDAYKNIEESDAMGLVTLDTYRDLKIRNGEWNESLERLYAWANREPWEQEIAHYNWATGEIETVTREDLTNPDGSRTVFTMLKPQYFGPMAERGEFIPGMYKLAVAPILPNYENEAMSNVREYMEDNDINLLTFESANKVGTKNPGEQVYGVSLKEGVSLGDITQKPDVAPDGITQMITFEGDKRAGNISYTETDNKRRIIDAVIKQEYRGQGVGRTAYIKIGDKALDDGKELVSDVDTQRSPSANALWQSLESSGLATKVGDRFVYDTHSSELNGKPVLSNLTTQDTYYDYWGLQLQTGNKIKNEVILGSQFMKQIVNGIYSKGQPVSARLEELEQQMRETHRGLIEQGKQELIDELGLQLNEDGNYTIESVENLMEFLEDQALQRDVNTNVIDSIQLLGYYLNQGNLGLSILSNRDKVENILASIADSRVITQKVHGGPKVQAASTFFEQQARKKGTKTSEFWNSNPELDFYEDTGTMEVYMPHYFKGYFQDMDVDEITDDRLLQAIGFRIPTSGLNVIERIKIKGFLPQDAGEIVVLPSEIVAKAGSDFDVDKLNMLLPNYRYNSETGENEYIEFIEGDTTKKPTLKALYMQRYGREIKLMEAARKNLEKAEAEFDEWLEGEPQEDINALIDATGLAVEQDWTLEEIKSELKTMGQAGIAERLDEIPTPQEFVDNNAGKSIYELNSKRALQNRLLEISYDILAQEESKNQMFDPIGIDKLDDQKDRINDLRGVEGKDLDYGQMMFDFKFGMELTQRNIESISGTGSSALHVSDHVHATKHNYMMHPDHEINLPHQTAQRNDDELVSIGSKYNVDGESIGELLNQMTNMFIDGVKNPISNALNLNLETLPAAMYMIRAGMSTDTVFNILNQPIVRDYIRLKSIKNATINQASNPEDVIINSNEQIDNMLKKKYAKKSANVEITDKLLEKHMNPSSKGGIFKSFQKKVLDEYKRMENGGRALNEYVQATRIDTQAMGKNTSELDLMLRKLGQIETGDEIINARQVLKDDGFLAPHYEALKDFQKMFEPFFIHRRNPEVSDLYDDFVDFVDKKEISTEDKVKLLDKFKSDFVTHVILNADTNINREPIDSMGASLELFTGKNSLPKRIASIKKQGTTNLLLDNLLPIIGQEQVNGQVIDNLKLMDQRLDSFEQDGMIMAWKELFSDKPQTATDLVRFAIQQDGLQLTPMTFSKYIPAHIFMEMADDAFRGNPNIGLKRFMRKFFENNYNDENLVPTEWSSKVDGPIVKKFPLKEGVTKDDIGAMLDANQRPWTNTPTIIIRGDEGLMVGDRQVFSEGEQFQPFAIKDYRNNRSFLSYGLDIQPQQEARYEQVDKPQLTEDQRRAQIQELNAPVSEQYEQHNQCNS